MKKFTLMITMLALAALACANIQLVDPAKTQQPSAETPDALATVLAEVAQATEKAPTPTDIPPTTVPTETETPEATAEEEEEEVEATATSTPKPTAGNTGYPTAISLPDPATSNFFTCEEECKEDGSNHQPTFPEKTSEIFLRFDYEEFPIKAPYVRKWTKDGILWAQYTCLWEGPESGTEEISLTDPNGLASGIWTIEITVNGEKVLEQTLLIDGSYSYWAPPGFFNGCYGKK